MFISLDKKGESMYSENLSDVKFFLPCFICSTLSLGLSRVSNYNTLPLLKSFQLFFWINPISDWWVKIIGKGTSQFTGQKRASFSWIWIKIVLQVNQQLPSKIHCSKNLQGKFHNLTSIITSLLKFNFKYIFV